MTSIQEDYILRMIQMMGEVIIAALKMEKTGFLTEADQTLSKALDTIMPNHAELIEGVDEMTAVALLSDPRLIEAYTELLLERAEIKAMLEDESEAEYLQSKALRIFITTFNNEPKLSIKGQLIRGRMAGFELPTLLNKTELAEWNKIQQLTESDSIGHPR